VGGHARLVVGVIHEVCAAGDSASLCGVVHAVRPSAGCSPRQISQNMSQQFRAHCFALQYEISACASVVLLHSARGLVEFARKGHRQRDLVPVHDFDSLSF